MWFLENAYFSQNLKPKTLDMIYICIYIWFVFSKNNHTILTSNDKSRVLTDRDDRTGIQSAVRCLPAFQALLLFTVLVFPINFSLNSLYLDIIINLR